MTCMADEPMLSVAALPQAEIEQLRRAHYNAQVIHVRQVHDELRIVRIRPDGGPARFEPGQYCVLGLGNWEPRVPGCQEERLDAVALRKVLKRPYSFSCPLLDDQGRLLPPRRCDFLEFYITLVRRGSTRPPGLTPRLFALRVGDRLWVGPKVTGHYTLAAVRPSDNVVFVATGTGEAPHNAMVAHLLDAGHQGRLVCVTCVRWKRDLGYLDQHRELQRRYANYRYLTLTTREPENVDPTAAGYVGKRYVQEYFASGEFTRDSQLPLQPDHTHVYLCGNPAMIGAPLRDKTGVRRYPQPRGMVEVLEGLGFRADEPHAPGNIHFEKYW
jgi:ferredoxin--NADP+ reductase